MAVCTRVFKIHSVSHFSVILSLGCHGLKWWWWLPSCRFIHYINSYLQLSEVFVILPFSNLKCPMDQKIFQLCRSYHMIVHTKYGNKFSILSVLFQ